MYGEMARVLKMPKQQQAQVGGRDRRVGKEKEVKYSYTMKMLSSMATPKLMP